MAGGGSIRETLGWAGAFTAGVWLSVRVARWLTDQVAGGRYQDSGGNGGPVREVVEDVLGMHRTEDTPMVHAFEQALEAEEAEEAGERARA